MPQRTEQGFKKLSRKANQTVWRRFIWIYRFI